MTAPVPVGVLLPLRIETRFKPGQLLLRVVPDEPWFTGHDPAVTDGELELLRLYRGGGATPDAFRALVAAVGGPRAVYLIRSGDTAPRSVEPALPRIARFPDQLQVWLARGGAAPDGRNPAGTLHWVSAAHALPVEARLYDRLFTVEKPGETKEADFLAHLDPNSLEVLEAARIEPAVAGAEPGSRFQFERLGYFYLEPEDSTAGRMVFNRIVALRDAWARKAEPGRAAG